MDNNVPCAKLPSNGAKGVSTCTACAEVSETRSVALLTQSFLKIGPNELCWNRTLQTVRQNCSSLLLRMWRGNILSILRVSCLFSVPSMRGIKGEIHPLPYYLFVQNASLLGEMITIHLCRVFSRHLTRSTIRPIRSKRLHWWRNIVLGLTKK